jgi:hypothetical protein
MTTTKKKRRKKEKKQNSRTLVTRETKPTALQLGKMDSPKAP